MARALPFLLVAMAVAVGSTPAAPGVEFSSDLTGNTLSYAVRVNGQLWLQSGDTAFFADHQWYSAAAGTLKVSAVANTTGSDAMGSFSAQTVTWQGGANVFVTVVRTYPDFVVYEQVWPNGADNTNAGTPDDVASAFPSFLNASAAPAPLGVVGWYGTFIDDAYSGPRIGRWPASASTGRGGGVNAIFDETGAAVVVSAQSQFMAASFASTLAGQLSAGLLGSVTSVPANYSLATIVYANATVGGINNAMTAWGQLLLRAYGKPADGFTRDQTTQTLGYNTDHGAYYYYKPETGKDYLGTLLDVKQYADKVGIPYKWVLLDSWWYFKGVGDGVKNWTAMPQVFPGGNAGIKQLVNITGWPIIGHNRYWSSNTDYATQNGGKFAFSDTQYDMVVPLELDFWRYLLSTSAEWGLTVYEQDWLYNEFDGVPLLTQSATQARTWLLQMGQAATENGLTIQYCMPYPRHALQSVEIPAVTQIRVSDDYVPNIIGSQKNWNIGASSILAHSLGLVPFKDSFWSTKFQKGSSQRFGAHEPTPAREAAVSTLTAGPVTPSDGVGFSDVALILRSCRSDGRLLQPSRPAATHDAVFLRRALGAAAGGPDGEVWTTYTVLGDDRWDHVFATKLAAPFAVPPSLLTLDRPAGVPSAMATVAYAVDTETFDRASLQVLAFSATAPLALAKSPSSVAFELWHTAPVHGSWALLGDLAKWIPVAAARFASVTVTPDGLSVLVLGAANERVTVTFAHGTAPVDVVCEFGPAGGARTAVVPVGSCS